METTSLTLLEQLRGPVDQSAWTRFVQVYTPLVRRCVFRVTSQSQEADEILQDVFVTLFQKMKVFSYDRDKGRFHNWLQTVVCNKCLEHLRKTRRIPQPDDEQVRFAADRETARQFDEREHEQYLIGRVSELVEMEMNPRDARVFREYAVLGHPTKEVADKFGISVALVFQIKARALKLIRQRLNELGELLS